MYQNSFWKKSNPQHPIRWKQTKGSPWKFLASSPITVHILYLNCPLPTIVHQSGGKLGCWYLRHRRIAKRGKSELNAALETAKRTSATRVGSRCSSTSREEARKQEREACSLPFRTCTLKPGVYSNSRMNFLNCTEGFESNFLRLASIKDTICIY